MRMPARKLVSTKVSAMSGAATGGAVGVGLVQWQYALLITI